ncbi:AAA family ATPase [Fulvivirgaceae bacterium PWU4]|uniref:AAA family ATPase n=1 Tax=Chryseosolibacter histidini TaxID=2782349 RepID=A0AAP2GHC9_9BACT|nr:AAA family ATPase [Chryseosolibacter histidini]MBT1695919.1 AAA family ATPase [Chryseosolibacter histidini]
MQIHYLWINDFGRLQKAGINLSSKLIVEMETDKDAADHYTLTISENPEYIHNFFDKENISNVTAIIGKNGAGKTTILNYLKSHLPVGLQANVKGDLFIYSIGKDGANQEFFIIKPDYIKVKLENKTTIKFHQEVYGENVGETFRFTGELGDAGYIYYSYLLDFNQDITPWRGLTNISTSFLMMEERRRIVEENRVASTRVALLSDCNDLDNLHMSEVQRAIQLLLDESLTLPFDKPNTLIIEIDLNDISFFSDQESTHTDIHKILKEFKKERSLSDDRVDDLIKNFLLAIFVNSLIDDHKYGGLKSPSIPERKPQINEPARDYILSYFSNIADSDDRKMILPRHKSLQQLVPQLVALLEQLIRDKIVTIEDASTMQFSINETTEGDFRRFSRLYLQVKGISAFLNFRWRTLSGGEQSYLSLMSRFYDVRHHQIGDLPHNLVILIDEGDVGYHPEWQRRFLDITLNFLSQLFEGHTLQLIITANTPFLSSDLPKSHVLFVEWIDNKVSTFHSKHNSREQTFGANIHTLFSNSFYMDGILMGEFAKKRINKIIDYLKEPLKQNEAPNEGYKKTIDVIGEPVLKRKLQDMWLEKFGLDEELRMLQRRIDEINHQKAKK